MTDEQSKVESQPDIKKILSPFVAPAAPATNVVVIAATTTDDDVTTATATATTSITSAKPSAALTTLGISDRTHRTASSKKTTLTTVTTKKTGTPSPSKSAPTASSYAHPITKVNKAGAPPVHPVHHPYPHHHYYAYHHHMAAASATDHKNNVKSNPTAPYTSAQYKKLGVDEAAARAKQQGVGTAAAPGQPAMYPPPPPGVPPHHHHAYHAYHAWAAYRYAQQHPQYHVPVPAHVMQQHQHHQQHHIGPYSDIIHQQELAAATQASQVSQPHTSQPAHEQQSQVPEPALSLCGM